MLWSRKKKNALPWKSLVPERVTVFTTPEAEVPEERSNVRAFIWNSWTTSAEKFCAALPV